ncbi:MAG: DUF1273 family protein [Clostridia bacterium]|nr:DUF1273 family protein [Clostridia bacterium]
MLKTATFIGHRDLPVLDNSKVKNCIRRLIEEHGCERFLCGGMGDFDNMCARTVWELKQTYPYIQNHLVIPYLSFTAQNPFCYDEIIFPAELEGVYFKKCILLRNKYLIDHADAAICCINHSWGGAYKTYLYAKSNHIPIFDLQP